jgi:hypothetical protein
MSCNEKCLCTEFDNAIENLGKFVDYLLTGEEKLCDLDNQELLYLFSKLNATMAVVGEEIVNRQVIDNSIGAPAELAEDDKCPNDSENENNNINDEEEDIINIKIRFTDEDGALVEKEVECTTEEFNQAISEMLSEETEEASIKAPEISEEEVINTYAAEDYIMNNKLERPVKYEYGKSYIVRSLGNNVYYLHKPLFTVHEGELSLKTVKAVSLAGDTDLNGPAYVPIANIKEIELA